MVFSSQLLNLLHAVFTVHKHQISPSQTFRKSLGMLLTDTYYCLSLYSMHIYVTIEAMKEAAKVSIG